MSALPLVSCIMPTANRRAFVPQAIQYFLRQDYPEKELVILDDGEDSVADLIPADPRIRYFRKTRRQNVGAKRNALCEEARGELIAHWDDDDWDAPRRLALQVEALEDANADLCGINQLLFFAPKTQRAWEYSYPARQRPWLSGSTLLYRRDLWRTHPFADVNVGEDARFVWSALSARLHVLRDHGFHIGIVHDRNASPKRVHRCWWREIDPERIRALLGADFDAYSSGPPSSASVTAIGPVVPASSPVRPIRNLFACLVHEAAECVVDLVRNLRHLDPASAILLYNGGADPDLLKRDGLFSREEVIVHPNPRPMRWGALHEFALDCMRFAQQSLTFDTLTIVDSDQLGLRPGYSGRLAEYLASQTNLGLLGNNADTLGPRTRVPPAATAWKEVELWRPFLRQFPDGEQAWVHWSFWPSTVFTADACRALVELFDSNRQLRDILRASKLWATEEILFPTLTALLGFRVLQSPFSYDFCKYRRPYSLGQLRAALAKPDAYWMHPVPRRADNTLRRQIRGYFSNYDKGTTVTTETKTASLFMTLPVLERMRRIEGWLEEDEADLLISAAQAACHLEEGQGAIVEIGSFCGRSTVVLASVARTFGKGSRVHAVDPHDGKVGAADQDLKRGPPTIERFRRNIEDAGVADVVDVIQKFSWEVSWNQPIALLFIDGLHDYANVARDFRHFEPWLTEGAYIAFHDYADYYPGVKAFVHELLAESNYEEVQRVRSMMLLRRTSVSAIDSQNRMRALA